MLLPFATGGAMGAAFAVVTILADQSRPFPARLIMLALPAGIGLWTLSACAGLPALWAVVLLPESDVIHRPRLPGMLTAGLLVGLVAATGSLFMMARTSDTYDWRTWAIWIGLLLGPIVVGARHLFLLMTRRHGIGP